MRWWWWLPRGADRPAFPGTITTGPSFYPRSPIPCAREATAARSRGYRGCWLPRLLALEGGVCEAAGRRRVRTVGPAPEAPGLAAPRRPGERSSGEPGGPQGRRENAMIADGCPSTGPTDSRLSVTDRCHFRCAPATAAPAATFHRLRRGGPGPPISSRSWGSSTTRSACARCAYGREPLLRPDLPELVSALRAATSPRAPVPHHQRAAPPSPRGLVAGGGARLDQHQPRCGGCGDLRGDGARRPPRGRPRRNPRRARGRLHGPPAEFRPPARRERSRPRGPRPPGRPRGLRDPFHSGSSCPAAREPGFSRRTSCPRPRSGGGWRRRSSTWAPSRRARPRSATGCGRTGGR